MDVLSPDISGAPVVTRPTCLTLAQFTRGEAWRLELAHPAESARLIWITKGQGRATIRGIRRGIGIHNLLYIPRGCLMSLWPGPKGFGQVVELPAPGDLGLPDTPVHLRIRDVTAQAEFTGYLENMLREQQMVRPLIDEAMQAHGRLMSVWLRRHMGVDDDRPSRGAGARLVRAYAMRLEQHSESPATMGDHAEALGVTPTHLTRTCRDHAGCTAANLLIQTRLHAARSMLASGDRPVQEVSHLLGFSSPAYFTRFMRRYTGKNPSALRAEPGRRA